MMAWAEVIMSDKFRKLIVARFSLFYKQNGAFWVH